MFRNRAFVEWLRHTAKHEPHISVIVYVETLLWYKSLGLARKDFDEELAAVQISVIGISEALADEATAFAMRHRKEFPFRHHARDYIIGTTALENAATLLTYNTNDFKWVVNEGGTVLTPEDFLSAKLR